MVASLDAVLQISIHALREEGDTSIWRTSIALLPFLSTPSARRATVSVDRDRISLTISIHALREEGDFGPDRRQLPPQKISIHALREEGDGLASSSALGVSNFYPRPPRGGRHKQSCKAFITTSFLSTPSARRATSSYLSCFPINSISIHALREEGDYNRRSKSKQILYFYPRPPRGGRHGMTAKEIANELFLSTPSARRATYQTSRTLIS